MDDPRRAQERVDTDDSTGAEAKPHVVLECRQDSTGGNEVTEVGLRRRADTDAEIGQRGGGEAGVARWTALVRTNRRTTT
jgi:hypothetical protein